MTAAPDPPLPLAGRTIAVAEGRELELLARLLERRGASVLRYPLVRICDAPDPAPVLHWLHRFMAGECDELILQTGEGLRRLLACLERHEPASRPALLTALGRVRTVTRGPKPARALRDLGLLPTLQAPQPTTEGLVELLQHLDLGGHCVGLQLYGAEPNPRLTGTLLQQGATVLPVAPYVYADMSSDAHLRSLLARIADDEIDALVFTSRSQVERLWRAAPGELLLASLRHTTVAAVGPVVARALADRGVSDVVTPSDNWFLKPLASELARALGAQEQ